VNKQTQQKSTLLTRWLLTQWNDFKNVLPPKQTLKLNNCEGYNNLGTWLTKPKPTQKNTVNSFSK
jgi:hypothetical protein